MRVAVLLAPLVRMPRHVHFVDHNLDCSQFLGSGSEVLPLTVLGKFAQMAAIIIADKL